MISVNNNVKLLNSIVGIERDYLDYFGKEFAIDYEHLYKDIFDDRLSQLCSSIHYQLVKGLRILNDSINGGRHFWADPSRDLIKSISLSSRFVNNLKNSGEKVRIVEYYDKVLKKCNSFLSSSGEAQYQMICRKLKYTTSYQFLKYRIFSSSRITLYNVSN